MAVPYPAENHEVDDGSAHDSERTTRNHAGEAIEDSRAWPGYILLAATIFLVAAICVAAGYGYEGWAWIASIVAILTAAAGLTIVLLERRRVKNREGLGGVIAS